MYKAHDTKTLKVRASVSSTTHQLLPDSRLREARIGPPSPPVPRGSKARPHAAVRA